MNERTGVPSYMNNGMGHDSRTFFLTYSVSFLCHVIIFTVLIFAPMHAPEKRYIPDVVNVSMVSLPAQKPAVEPVGPAAEKKDVGKAVPKKTRPLTEPSPTKRASVAKEHRKAKKSLKKETFKSSRVVKKAIERIEKTVETETPSPLEEAFDRLQKQVGKTEAIDRLKEKLEPNGKGQMGVVLPGAAPGPQKILEIIDIYRVEIAYKVQNNWAFSGQLAGDAANLQASLVFKVMPNGVIRDIFFTDRSGNKYLDESAYKAVVKTNPVDPHPSGVNRPYVNVGLRFTPEGVR
jgi:colicin import membrane protein